MKIKSMIVSIATLFCVWVISATVTAESLNSVVAVVNQGVITQNDLDFALSQAKHELAETKTPNTPPDAQLRNIVLQQLINRKIELELADEAHITVSHAKVIDTIAKIATENHLTRDALKQKLQQRGLSFDAFKKNLEEQLRIQKVQESAVGSQIQITPADIANARAQYQTQMNNQQMYHVIDINVPSATQAQHIATQLKKGKNINDFRKNMNDLGWHAISTLPTLFTDALSHMSPGDVAGPIQAPNGYHVLKLLAQRGAQTTAPTTAQLKNYAYQLKMQQAVQTWLEKVRKTAYIKITQP